LPELWDPWQISEIGFPAKGEVSDRLRYLINYAVLAPSSHNSQPWLFRIVGEEIELYADRTRALPVCDPNDRELIISCGAALYHLRLAFRYFGYEGLLQTLPDPTKPDLLARVGFGGAYDATEYERRLFHAIVRRRTNRKPFEPRPVPEKLLGELKEAARSEGTWFQVVQGEEIRNRVADLIAEGDHIQMSNSSFRRELAAWIHSNRTASHDGMPAYSQGYGDLSSIVVPIIVRTFDFGRGQAAKDRQLATGSPALAILGTDGDSVQDWLTVGQALSRVLLYARSQEVWASFLNQPIEVPELRSRLADLVGTRGFPQLMLRLGYGPDVKPTPRRSAGEVLVKWR